MNIIYIYIYIYNIYKYFIYLYIYMKSYLQKTDNSIFVSKCVFYIMLSCFYCVLVAVF